MRNLTNLILAALICGAASTVASAYAPSVADLDAEARAVGNRRDIAEKIGEAIFTTEWPAEVSQVSANELGSHLVVGIRIWGVKFHRPLRRTEFVDEVVTLTQQIFTVEPNAEEIDFWASIPIDVSKGAIVSGDLARPTSETVFSLTVRRDESPTSARERALRDNDGVFWNEEWAREAFHAHV